MKSHKFFNISLFIVTLFFGFIAKADYGLFMVVKGDVKVQKADAAPTPAKVGLKVAVGDMIISAADSRAKIVMSDRNVINITPLTKIKIEKYATGANKNVELNLTEGKIRTNVEQEYDGEKSKFLIKTPTAVAGVRGTQFITSFDVKRDLTEVVTLKGTVALTSLNSTMPPVLVNKGQGSSVAKDGAPEPPKVIPADVLKQLDRDSDGKDRGDGKGSKGGGGDKRIIKDDGPPPPPPPPPPGPGPGPGPGPCQGCTQPPPPPSIKPLDPKTKVKVVPTGS